MMLARALRSKRPDRFRILAQPGQRLQLAPVSIGKTFVSGSGLDMCQLAACDILGQPQFENWWVDSFLARMPSSISVFEVTPANIRSGERSGDCRAGGSGSVRQGAMTGVGSSARTVLLTKWVFFIANLSSDANVPKHGHRIPHDLLRPN